MEAEASCLCLRRGSRLAVRSSSLTPPCAFSYSVSVSFCSVAAVSLFRWLSIQSTLASISHCVSSFLFLSCFCLVFLQPLLSVNIWCMVPLTTAAPPLPHTRVLLPGCRYGHMDVDYARWYSATSTYEITSPNIYFEPYFIGWAGELPWFDERFRGYGAGDKALQFHLLYKAGIKVEVLPLHFVLHLPHARGSWQQPSPIQPMFNQFHGIDRMSYGVHQIDFWTRVTHNCMYGDCQRRPTCSSKMDPAYVFFVLSVDHISCYRFSRSRNISSAGTTSNAPLILTGMHHA